MSASVFPARAGMSPQQTFEDLDALGVPRASGDEPMRLRSFREP